MADGAEAQLRLQLADRVRQRERVLFAAAQNVKGQPLGRFFPHPRQLGELVNQLVQRLRKAGHGTPELSVIKAGYWRRGNPALEQFSCRGISKRRSRRRFSSRKTAFR